MHRLQFRKNCRESNDLAPYLYQRRATHKSSIFKPQYATKIPTTNEQGTVPVLTPEEPHIPQLPTRL